MSKAQQHAIDFEVDQAIAFLEGAGGSPRLIRHARLVEGVAGELVSTLRSLGVLVDEQQVRLGAALHDAGKIVHPDELEATGDRHERAGYLFLLEHGYPTNIAEACVRHSQWEAPDAALEFLVIALADKLWKGKRDERLESAAIERVAQSLNRQHWEVLQDLDTAFELVAASGHRRLIESQDP
jgi:HD superfamily phosphodiesterase